MLVHLHFTVLCVNIVKFAFTEKLFKNYPNSAVLKRRSQCWLRQTRGRQEKRTAFTILYGCVFASDKTMTTATKSKISTEIYVTTTTAMTTTAMATTMTMTAQLGSLGKLESNLGARKEKR